MSVVALSELAALKLPSRVAPYARQAAPPKPVAKIVRRETGFWFFVHAFAFLFNSRISERRDSFKRLIFQTLYLLCKQIVNAVGARSFVVGDSICAQRIFAFTELQILIPEFQRHEKA